ncbi:LSU ribosomal protein L19p [hydrothermal vent metagenome]|uniref:LSU ribosomal protein L19p n=1 Tax=hydrothermal vent metagenome TaxID=652676 RepID=A0A3B1D029_9ZZZZ
MSTQQLIDNINTDNLKADIPTMDVGDTINVHARIVEGEKERIQVFQGVLISRKGRGINEMILVRRVVDNQGVERTWPINSPMIAKFEVVRRADARRGKLYFLRDRVGKKRRLRDRRRGLKHVAGQKTVG